MEVLRSQHHQSKLSCAAWQTLVQATSCSVMSTAAQLYLWHSKTQLGPLQVWPKLFSRFKMGLWPNTFGCSEWPCHTESTGYLALLLAETHPAQTPINPAVWVTVSILALIESSRAFHLYSHIIFMWRECLEYLLLQAILTSLGTMCPCLKMLYLDSTSKAQASL